ncbi:ABC transporter permease subunit [Gordonia aurantiaca]|uniref:ABC transporter permease subunit n=1 Tax=Gordonia sp. B21 TaxID=3151852 RepID=UPI003264AC64
MSGVGLLEHRCRDQATLLVGIVGGWGERLAHAPAITKILITIGLMLVLEAIVRIIWTNHQETVEPFLVGGGFEVAGVRVQSISLLLAAVAILATIALHLLFTRTSFGHITTALRDTDLGAQSIGLNPRLCGSVAWVWPASSPQRAPSWCCRSPSCRRHR